METTKTQYVELFTRSQDCWVAAGDAEHLAESERGKSIMDTITTLPAWRIRLMHAHEHETLPKPEKRANSSQATAGKMIKQTLKYVFPGVTFSVASKGYSGGNHVRIEWTDGPTDAMVEFVANRHEAGHFDGQVDCYFYSNSRDDIPQAKYVFCNRHYSRPVYQAAIDVVNARYGYHLRINERYIGVDNTSDEWTGHGHHSHDLFRYIDKLSLLCPSCDVATIPGDQFCPQCGASLKEGDES